jgi:8-oxo-dGTP pyrophosphatase MutT (NUDIX family)
MGDMPSHAKKVFTGEIFDVYQWEQKMYDGSTQIFERLDRDDTVDVLATTKDGNILIERQSQPDRDKAFLCLIGGRIEAGEDTLEAAKREMLEETGYTSEEWSLLMSCRLMDKIHWNMYVCVARHCEKTTQQHLDPGERIDVREVTFDEFLDLVDSGDMRRIHQEIRVRCIRAKYHRPSYEAFYREIFGKAPS